MRNTIEMLWELGLLEIGVGTLVATNQRVEEAIEPIVSELSAWLQQEHAQRTRR